MGEPRTYAIWTYGGGWIGSCMDNNGVMRLLVDTKSTPGEALAALMPGSHEPTILKDPQP